jgi:hypothetical protein
LRRTYKCASFLSFCAPCIWSFLQSHPAATFCETIKVQNAQRIAKSLGDWKKNPRIKKVINAQESFLKKIGRIV